MKKVCIKEVAFEMSQGKFLVCLSGGRKGEGKGILSREQGDAVLEVCK